MFLWLRHHIIIISIWGGGNQPIALIAQTYDNFRSDAVALNLVRVQNNALYDVPNRTQSPFQRDTLFIAAPKETTFFQSTVRFVIPSDKVISDLGITNLSINWGTGNGFQPYTIGQNVSIGYPRSATYATIVRWTDAAGRILQTQFDVTIDLSLENIARSCNSTTYRVGNDCSQTEAINLPDGRSGAIVTTFFACPDRKLRKPLFILDGIDFNPFGNTATAERLASRLQNAAISLNPNDPSLSEILKTEGYDLVFVDWNGGGQQDIRLNSQLFRQILTLFNARKRANGSDQKNMVIGMSMGGVVGKHALRTMELANPTAANGGHDVATFIPFDSPMQGANIPLGLQALVNDINSLHVLGMGLRDINDNFNQIITTLESKAARQLLRVSAFEANKFSPATHNEFFTEFRNLGNLEKCTYRAVSNGSLRSVPNFAPNVPLLSLGGGTPFRDMVRFEIAAELNALPAAGDGAERRICRTKMTVFLFSIFAVDRAGIDLKVRGTDAGVDAFDGCPGGRLPLGDDIGSLTNGLPSGIRATQGDNLLISTFIPTVSALDIRLPERQNLAFNVENNQTIIANNITATSRYVGARGQTPLDNTTSLSAADNQTHVDFSLRIVFFLLQELEKRNALALNSNLTDKTFNFGNVPTSPAEGLRTPPLNELNHSVLVSNTGKLWVNRAGRQQFTDVPTNSANNPFLDFTLLVRGGCEESVITLVNNGTFHVGEPFAMNKATVRVSAGGVIKVQNGGHLNVESESRLIIENGGKLVLETGGNVHFLGNTAKIIIKKGGQLVLNGQPNLIGTGYFRFEENGQLLTELIAPLKGTLRGANTTQRLIQIARESMVEITSGSIALEKGMIERERGYNGNGADHIVVRPNATFSATEVNFDDHSFGPSRFIVLDGHNKGEFNFERCAFNGGGYNVYLQEPLNTPTAAERTYPWHRNQFRVDLHFKDCVLGGVKAERAYIVELNQCTVNGSIDVSYAYWVDLHNNTTFRGNGGGGTAVKVKNVVHTELYDNSLIDQYDTGIDATQSWNHNITMYDHASIQSCNTGIHLMGGVNNAYGLDWGMIYMDCARLLENVVAIQGEDILFNMYERNGKTNLLTRQPNLIGMHWQEHRSMLFNALFNCRKESDLWFHGSYWGGMNPGTDVESEFWSFKKKPTVCHPGYGTVAWDGTLHIDEWGTGAVITDPNHPSIVTCGGVDLRTPNRNSDIMAQNTIVFADGQYRDVKIQQDVALLRLRQQQLSTAETLFEPIARLSQNVRDTANAVVKHMIDVARVMAIGNANQSNGLARNDFGWLPEATVSFDKTDSEVHKVKLYPNPANDFFRLELKAGSDYEVQIYDVVGKRMESLDTKTDWDFDTKNWKSGVYMIQVLNKTNQQRTYGKIVIQH